MPAFDAGADAPVASTAVAADDKLAFVDTSANGWDTVRLDQFLDALLRVADTSAGKGVVARLLNKLYAAGGLLINNAGAATPGALWIVRADGVTPGRVLLLNAGNNVQFGPDNDGAYVSFGGAANNNRSGSEPLVTAGRSLWWESWYFDSDWQALRGDSFERLRIGFGRAGDSLRDVLLNCSARSAVRFLSDGVQVASISGGRLGVRAGTSTGNQARVGGCLFDHYATAATTLTNGTEEDLFADAMDAGSLSADGDKVRARYAGTFAGHATATRKLKAYFGGTAIFDSTAQVSSASSNWTLDAEVVRVSATSVRYVCRPSMPGLATQPPPSVGTLTGLTLSAGVAVKIAGAAAAAGAASGDIAATFGTVDWVPAALATPVGIRSLRPYFWLSADVGTYQGVANSAAAATANNAPVVLWEDQSGNGRHFSQALGGIGSAPILKTASQNGLPGLQFDGVNDFLVAQRITDGLLSAAVSPLSLYVVAKVNAWDNVAIHIMIGDAAGLAMLQAHYLFGTWAASAGGSSLESTAVSTGVVKTAQVLFNGASSEIGLNGGTKTTGNAGTGYPVNLGIGARADGTDFTSMTAYAAVAFDYVLTAPQEAIVLEELRTKWGHY